MTELIVDIVREFLDYNPETGEFRWKYRDRKWFPSDRSWKMWNTRYANTTTGVNSNGYLIIGIFDKSYYAHRLAWLHYYGEWPKSEIDHRNQVKIDNRIENLRDITHPQNLMNGAKQVWGKSEYRGVVWSKKGNKWQAQIKANGKTIFLGYFIIEEDAARAYDRAALEYFEEYASLNFPLEKHLEEVA